MGQRLDGVQHGPQFVIEYLKAKYDSLDICTSSEGFGYEKLLQKHLKCKTKPVVTIGGDHSISMATVASSVLKSKNLHVIWIDAHADLNTPHTSTTGNKHGMPVSTLLGKSALIDIPKKLSPSQITYVGLRDIDPFELRMLQNNSMHWYSSQDVLTQGINQVISSIKLSTCENTQFHISLDVDVFDPSVFPCTGTPVKNGLSPDDVRKLIREFRKQTIAIDVVEFNPLVKPNDISSCLRTIDYVISGDV